MSSVDKLIDEFFKLNVKTNKHIIMFLDYDTTIPLPSISWRIYVAGKQTSHKSFKPTDSNIINSLKADLKLVTHILCHNTEDEMKLLKNTMLKGETDIINLINSKKSLYTETEITTDDDTDEETDINSDIITV